MPMPIIANHYPLRLLTELSSESPKDLEVVEAYNRHIAYVLRRAGLLRFGRRNHEYYYPNRFEEIHNSDCNTPQVRGYHRWTWDIELHSGRFWLVPRMSFRYVTTCDPMDPRLLGWLRTRLERRQWMPLNLLNLRTGDVQPIRLTLEAFTKRRLGDLLPRGTWHVTLSMKDLKTLNSSQDVYCNSHEMIRAGPDDLSETPFCTILESVRPLDIPTDNLSRVDNGQHLRFGKGVGSNIKSVVIGKGLVEKPAKPVRLLICAPKELWAKERVKQCMRYIFFKRNESRRCELGLPQGAETVYQIWQEKLGLPTYDFHKPTPVLTYTADGQVIDPSAIEKAVTQADADGRMLVALLLLPNFEMPKKHHNALHRCFRGKVRVVQFQEQTLTGKGGTTSASGLFAIWANITVDIAYRAGGVPWDLYDLPGVNDRTVFIGIDLGHDHHKRESQLAFTLVDHRGRKLLRRPRVIPSLDLNEALPDRDVLRRELRKVLKQTKTEPEQVIVHRDGRYFPGDEEKLFTALQGVPHVSLVSIKKDSQTRFRIPVEGLFWRFTHNRGLLITNTQDEVAAPLEVELRVPGRLTLVDAATQVFWLTRTYQGNVIWPTRLPITTRETNNVAGTGEKPHIKSWGKGNIWVDHGME